MPNAENVAAPINIHGFGRSGTTLLQNVLGATGFIQVCNETAGLVFSCYRGGELLLPSDDKEAPGGPGEPLLAVRALHAALCATLPSRKPTWCQKLGGIPNGVVWSMIDAVDRQYAAEPYPFPYGWYWQVLTNAFPHGRDLLILRDWRDVIASRVRFSGHAAEDVAADVAIYFNLMAHPANRIEHVIRYESLVASPAPVLSALFGSLGLAYSDRLTMPLDWHAAPSADRTLSEARKAGFSRQDQHEAVLTPAIRRTLAPALDRIAGRFGLELPG